ncbi:MAG TPA: M14 family zinc carboxypeptidase [Acidobacteriota bacterium]|nr:M14 family zinc carboxypeptidase [Acidobacteriota bacterium]
MRRRQRGQTSRRSSSGIRPHVPVAVLIALLLGPATAGAQRFEEFVEFEPSKEQFDFDRWPYRLPAEVNARLRELAAQYPHIVRAHHIGDSRQGRELLMMEITNFETGDGESKPGLWLEAGVHPNETPGPVYLEYFVERALAMHGGDPALREILDTTTFYVVTDLNPDSRQLALTSHPAWPGYDDAEQPGSDLNGDGYITQMRWKDDPGDQEYQYLPEGRLPGDDWHMDPLGYVWRSTSDTGWEVKDRERDWTGRREQPDYNRNFSAEWVSEDPGAGEFQFSLPEIYAVAKEMTDRKNIFFMHDIHAGGVGREWMIRPLSNQPYQAMHHEDNDLYRRLEVAWSVLSPGDQTFSDYYTPAGTGSTIGGLPPDWAYLHQGIYGFGAEVGGAGIDYDGSGEVTSEELDRWHVEEMGGQFAEPWTPYEHPELGPIEIGGYRVSPTGPFPPSIGEMMRIRADRSFRYLMYVASLAPEVRVVDVRSTRNPDGTLNIEAEVRNEGWISTYVTQRALEISGSTNVAGPGAALGIRPRDFPVLMDITVEGGEVVEGDASQSVGHLVGKLAYIRRWADGGEDLPSKTATWTIRPRGSGPVSVEVRASAHKAGSDVRTLEIR